MPAIRDFVASKEFSAVDAGLTLKLPTNQVNDLLVLWVVSDSGAPTWTLPDGWTQIFARNNGIATICAYKISSGSEPATVTVGSTVDETYSGAVVSILDADTTTPVGNVVDSGFSPTANSINTLPAYATTYDNSLVLSVFGSSTITMPCFAEGVMQNIVNEENADASIAVATTFQRTAGNIATSKYVWGTSSLQTVLGMIEVRAGSAGIIPAYVGEDNSLLYSPTYASGAFANSGYNVTPSSATSTNYASEIAGIAVGANTLAAGIAGSNLFPVLSRIGIGVNSTVLMQGFDYASSAGVDIGDRMILAHFGGSAAIDARSSDYVSSGRGTWLGLRSSAASNFKVWQVLGGDSPNRDDMYIPMLINPASTSNFASNGTLNTSSLISVAFFCSKTTSTNRNFYPAGFWFLSPLAIGGGSEALPISLLNIYNLSATMKARRSAILQGSSQVLLLQSVSIGNGDACYADLDGASIEIAPAYNLSKKTISSHRVDDDIFFVYNPSSTGTVKHRNGVISSTGRFVWGLHNDASVSATYDFTRLSVIGAGTINLNKAITVNRLILKDYKTLNVADATLANCTISAVPASSDSVNLNANTSFTGCTIDVSNVTAGNRWLSIADPSAFENCNFTGGGGHAIRLTTPGTYSFSANTLSGFGANGTDGAFFLNDSGGAVTINVAGGGSTPTYKNGSGASTTIVSGASLTLTGLKDGSDIVILQAGTETELANIDANTGTTYIFTYTTVEDIDICVYKTGYEAYTIRGYTLSGVDGSVPIAQRADRNYFNPE